MNTQSLLAIAGIVATTVFGVWAIAFAFRLSRNVRITYALDQLIALTRDITQNFPDLGVTFRGEPVSENLVLLKGYFINTGRRDISPDMIEDRISVNLPSEFEWVQCKVVESSPSLRASATKCNEQRIEFEVGLWKRKEYLKFEALAKVPVLEADDIPDGGPGVRLRGALSFAHRITDSKRIEQTRVPRSSKLRRMHVPLGFLLAAKAAKHVVWIGSLVVLVTGLFLFAGSKWGLFKTSTLGYTAQIDGQERVVTVRVSKDKLVLSGESGFRKESTLTDFESMPEIRPTVVRKAERGVDVLGIVYSVLGVLGLGLYGVRAFKERRMLAMIATQDTT